MQIELRLEVGLSFEGTNCRQTLKRGIHMRENWTTCCGRKNATRVGNHLNKGKGEISLKEILIATHSSTRGVLCFCPY